jgi:dipeptidyl aminopeptidase/acylaminoacyl peptidase
MIIVGRACFAARPALDRFLPFVWIHGGLSTRPEAELRDYARSSNPSRFLAAGYVVAVITYRSRDEDPQTSVSLEDSLAAVDHLRRLPYVDPRSVVVVS